MELKVWVDGVQRIVCGVTEVTTCQEVVIALAQAIGRTGRYTLIEKWRETERHLAPHENPVVSLNKWGQYASDVQLVLQRTGPSLSERPTSESTARAPERGLYRQSLPPLAKLRPLAADRSLRRREPKRKSLTFTGGAKGLRDIFGKSREEPRQRMSTALIGHFRNGAVTPDPGANFELGRLVQLQKDKLRSLESRLQACEVEIQAWLGCTDEGLRAEAEEGVAAEEEELLRLEQLLRRNEAEIQEEEFWENELRIEQESEHQLREQLRDLRARMQECELRLAEYLSRIQGMEAGLEAERLQQELREARQASEEEVRLQLEKVRAELELQAQHATRLENGCRAVERSLGHSSQRLQEKERELEQLTKELRQVNLQQFIQQTGTKVTVLPAEPADEEPGADPEEQSGSLQRLGSGHTLPTDLRALQTLHSSGFNPEGIYV
ncbi:ras association domain-containing protein 8b [Denticeps clupeoides]|uniref:Ras-associating domain-containing protein n=1 Tax=Denticeps clupeoides TaxID=299321 RepID=A0AAY4DAA1_9TELE|nr:ras association domain-containing protein 8 [Denticeps clupeoides]